MKTMQTNLIVHSPAAIFRRVIDREQEPPWPGKGTPSPLALSSGSYSSPSAHRGRLGYMRSQVITIMAPEDEAAFLGFVFERPTVYLISDVRHSTPEIPHTRDVRGIGSLYCMLWDKAILPRPQMEHIPSSNDYRSPIGGVPHPVSAVSAGKGFDRGGTYCALNRVEGDARYEPEDRTCDDRLVQRPQSVDQIDFQELVCVRVRFQAKCRKPRAPG